MLEISLYVAAGTLTALLAGVFFAYSISVNGALHRLKDIEYVRAMQAINAVIQNPLFFLSFMGTVALLPLVTFFARDDSPLQFGLFLASTVVYIIGAFGVTVAANVPLNEQLAKVNSSDPDAIAQARIQFEGPWNKLHTIRTVAAIIATILFFIACCL